MKALGTFIRPVSRRAGIQNSLPVFSVTKHEGFVPQSDYFKKRIASGDISKYKVVREGQFAYATIHLDEGSIGFAPQDCVVSPMYTVFEVDRSEALPTYLSRLLRSPQAIIRYQHLGRGSAERRKSISLEVLGTLQIPLPSLEDQRRIAAILDQADAIRTKRREQLAHLAVLAGAALDMAQGLESDRISGSLSDFGQVSSGITKGRRTSEPTRQVPYLAVANVQAGSLDLENVKNIEATEREINRYKLEPGDLVVTEGGDPDKLGRGTVWKGEIDLCLHQNHIFRIRPNPSKVLSVFLSALIGGREAKSYFLRCAKRTTGIASINMTQLRALPVSVPTLGLQREFARKVEAIDAQRERVQRALAADEELFASLQARAFKGEL